MPRKLAIHIGVNQVAPSAYPKLPETLRAAEADARAMSDLTRREAFSGTLLTAGAATRAAVITAISNAAALLEADDLLVLTFSGHGATFADGTTATAEPPPVPIDTDEPRRADAVNTVPGDEPRALPAELRPLGAANTVPGDEPFDQSWCLYDGVLVDDDLYLLLCTFRPDVRIYVLSDSCYSGSILQHASTEQPEQLRAAAPSMAAPPPQLVATVLLSAAAADTELTYTTGLRGMFTKAVLDVWDDGRFTGDHRAFHAAVQARAIMGQVPDLCRHGQRSPAFEHARPFTAATVEPLHPPPPSQPARRELHPSSPLLGVSPGQVAGARGGRRRGRRSRR